MNDKTFKAGFITCQEADGVIMVGFADDQFATSEYVLLQRTLAPKEQDRKLGLDGVHIEVDGPDNSGYDGIELIRLNRTDAEIVIGPKLLPFIGFESVHVSFDADDATFLKLREHLSKLVEGRIQLVS